jgi:hypothetical protein
VLVGGSDGGSLRYSRHRLVPSGGRVLPIGGSSTSCYPTEEDVGECGATPRWPSKSRRRRRREDDIYPHHFIQHSKWMSGGGLKAALCAMAQAKVDVGVFQETKLTDGIYVGVFQETKQTDGIYTCQSSGYQVIAPDAPSKHQGGITVF